MSDEDNKHLCQVCVWGRVSSARARLCVSEKRLITCMECGEVEAQVEKKRKASMVQIPFSKGAYQYIYNPADLIGTNPKRTT